MAVRPARTSVETVEETHSDETLLQQLTQRMTRYRLDYCSLSVDEAPFSQVERLAKSLKMNAVAGMLCHSILPKKSQVQFGGAKK